MSELQMTRLQVGGGLTKLYEETIVVPKNETGDIKEIDLTSKEMEKAFLSTNICLVEIENSSFLVRMGNINTFSKLEINTGHSTIVEWGLRAGNSEKYVESSIKKYLLSNFRLSALQHWWMEHGCQQAAVLLSGKLQFDSRPIQHYHSSLQNCLNLNSKGVSLL